MFKILFTTFAALTAATNLFEDQDLLSMVEQIDKLEIENETTSLINVKTGDYKKIELLWGSHKNLEQCYHAVWEIYYILDSNHDAKVTAIENHDACIGTGQKKEQCDKYAKTSMEWSKIKFKCDYKYKQKKEKKLELDFYA